MTKHKVLVVDDDEMIRELIRDFLSDTGCYEVIETRGIEDCLRQCQRGLPHVALIDYFLPDGNALDLLPKLKALDPSLPVLLLTGHGTINLAVQAIKQGAEQFITKPVELPVLEGLIARAIEAQRNRRKQAATTTQKSRYRRDPFLGTSAVIQRFAGEVQKIVGSESPLLIQGETGTGKGVLANWLHQQSPRGEEAIVDLNCAGLSRELLDSELFGFEKGAFTGAVNAKPGLLEVANHGTAFLDEIGDMDPLIQPKLLKVLEEKRFRRLGDVRDRSIDVRLIAATHQDLAKLVAEGRFRRDLFFRISTIPLHIPSLRERAEDIPMIARYFVDQLHNDLGRPALAVSEDAISALQTYHWPGNIRELRNVLERAALLAENGVIQARDLRFQLSQPKQPASAETSAETLPLDATLEDVERRYIALTLNRENGSVDRAAVKLGISRSSLYSKIKQYEIALRRGGSFHTTRC